MRTSSPSSFSLRLALALAGFGVACGNEPPPEGGGSETTTAGSSSGSAGGSFTSDTGAPSETSTGPATSTSSSGSGDEGEIFLSVPDGGNCFMVSTIDGIHPRCTFDCEPGSQDCGVGQKCVAWANDGGNLWNASRCAPVAEDPAAVGEPCTAVGSPVSGLDDCNAGSMCWGVDPQTLQGTCAPLCNPEVPAATCAEDEACAAYESEGDPYFAPHVCLPRCNPLDGARCPPDQACRAIVDEPLCVPLVSLPQGLWCSADQYCDGQVCVSAEELTSCDEPRCCRPWCDLSAPDPDLPCAAVPGEVCRPYFEEPPAGYESVGVCAMPPS